MDARAPQPATDRRPSVTRLAASLRRVLPPGAAQALCLPLCFLFARHLRFDAADPFWPDRDRLVVDAALAPLADDLAELAGLPANTFESPGPAVGIGAGLALSERLVAARFGRSLVDHRSWVMAAGDDLASGPAQEAAWLAGTWRLGRLTALAAVASPDAPGLAGFAAAAWSVRRVDAYDGADVAAALSAALRSQRPTLIACIWPHRMVAEDQQPEDCLAESLQAWLATGKRCAGIRRAWLKRLTRHASRQEFDNAMAGKLPAGWHAPFFEPGPLLAPGETAISTAATLRHAMLRMSATVPEITRLPADEAGRPGSAPAEASLVRDVPAGMVQGVGAAAAGLALHGGTVPVTKVSLAQATAMLATLRGAATASLRLVTFMAEPDRACPAGGQRASLRSIGNLCIFRPADASELLECAELAFRRTGGPTVLLVSEASVPLLSDRPTRTRCAKGGYVLAEAPSRRAVTLIASGPELHLALAVRAHLAAMGTPAAVVSLPCWRIFARQESSWQEAVLGGAPRVGIEAGSGFGWEKWLGPHGLFIGPEQIEGMTASGTAPQSAVSRIAELVLRHLGVVRAV